MYRSVLVVSLHKNITKNPLGSYPYINPFHVVYTKLQSHATTHYFKTTHSLQNCATYFSYYAISRKKLYKNIDWKLNNNNERGIFITAITVLVVNYR